MMHHFQYDLLIRIKYQNPRKILRSIGLKKGMTFMDIGCNDGFFTIPAAIIVGDRGKVYGIDIDNESIKRLEATAKINYLKNIITKTSVAEDTIFCNNCADIIFLGTILHDFSDPSKVLRNSFEMLKPSGKLINLDWHKKQTEMGPPLQKRLSQEEASNLLTESGFKIIDCKDISENYYQITAQKTK